MALARHFVGRYKIDVAKHALQAIGQLVRAGVGIVDALNHGVLEGDTPRSGLYIGAAGLQQFLHRPAVVDRHQPRADVVVRRMQRNGQRQLQLFLHELVYLIDKAAGGQ